MGFLWYTLKDSMIVLGFIYHYHYIFILRIVGQCGTVLISYKTSYRKISQRLEFMRLGVEYTHPSLQFDRRLDSRAVEMPVKYHG